ncbi:MAG: NB-ARC domain-containing protein [Chloroflexota bacterium]
METDPTQSDSQDEHKKVLITERAEINEAGTVIINPQGEIQVGDRYVLPETKPIQTQGLYGVPELPAVYIPRPEHLAPLKKILLTRKEAASLRLALQGMGGIGKSTMAAALARDPEIQSAFPHGIFWLAFGQQPNLLNLQAGLANLLETNPHTFLDMRDGRNQLERLLRGRTCMLILDDVWRSEHAELFNCLDPESRACMLVTTRKRDVISRLQAQLHPLDMLTRAQALALLAEWVKAPVEDLPPDAEKLAEECGDLPLALSMSGAMAAQKGWRHALERLRRADLDRIQTAFPDYPYPNLLRALQASLDDLNESKELNDLKARDHYLRLAVFPEDASIPATVIESLWQSGPDGLDELDSADLLDALIGRSLLQRDTKGNLGLHDLQRDFIQRIAKEQEPLADLHTKFLEACRAKIDGNAWFTLPDDGYIYEHLTWHMTQAGQSDVLGKLLLDYRWLSSKLEKTDIHELLRDYDQAQAISASFSNEIAFALRMVQGALRLSRHAFVFDKGQLAGQLLGRLSSFQQTEIRSILDQAVSFPYDRPWLRPLIGSLKSPGGAELFTLTGHNNEVTSVAVTPDGRLAASGSVDGTFRVWNLSDPEAEPRIFKETSVSWPVVTSVELAPDGSLAIWDVLDSGGVISRIWDLTDAASEPQIVGSEGKEKYRFWDPVSPGAELEKQKVIDKLGDREPLFVALDGQLAVTISDKTLQVWDLTKPDVEPRALTGHGDSVSAVALTPDGRLAVSGSSDNTIKVWDLTNRDAEPPSLAGHDELVEGAAITPDGHLAVSSSQDGTVKTWDLTSREVAPYTLPGVSIKPNHTLGITPDGRLAVCASSYSNPSFSIWDLTMPESEPRLFGGGGSVGRIKLTPDCSLAFSILDDSALIVWDLTNAGFAPRIFSGSTETEAVKLMEAALTPDGRTAVLVFDNHTLQVLDLINPDGSYRTFSHSLEKDNRVAFTDIAMTPDGRWAVSGWGVSEPAVSAYLNGMVMLHDLTGSITERRLFTREASVDGVKITPDGRLVIAAFTDYSLVASDLTDPSSEPRTLLQAGNFSRTFATAPGDCLTMTPDGRFLATIAGAAREVRVWDLKNFRCLASFTTQGRPFCVAMTDDARTVIVGEDSGGVSLLRLEGLQSV